MKNNKNNCKIIYEDKKYKLKEYFQINSKKELFEIKLKGIDNINNLSCIFNKCKSLLSISDISKWDTSNIVNMSYLFAGCELLEYLPDISEWDTSNVKYMHGIFMKCKSLKKLPDISKWNISNVIYMGGCFSDLSSLSPLSYSEIKEYYDNDEKVIDGGMFSGCKSLLSLPDISK